MKNPVLLLLLFPAVNHAQLSKQDRVWLPLMLFFGKWTGESEGQPGKRKYDRSYEFVINKKFDEVKNKSTSPLTANNPKREMHEDHGFISYDCVEEQF